MRHVQRGGPYVRMADPDWEEPLSPEYARQHGGRWNPPASFGVVYLNATVDVARAQVGHKLEPRGIRPEDLDDESGPVLVATTVPRSDYVDAVGDEGLVDLGLPRSYPLDDAGQPIPHTRCQPIGLRAWNEDEPGIACRSAAVPAGNGEELAFFARRDLKSNQVDSFSAWYW